MIEYALLVILGFCTAGLLAFLLAPTLWSRAVRLTTKRLEATMPMTLSEIEADKDLLRASYAIKIRRLEAGLNKSRDKSAHQLVDISRHQVQIAELNDRIAELNGQLDERRNAANVFESTIRKRFPELETMLATASAALDERASEIADLGMKLRRREEALDMAQRSAILQQDEIRQLRETLERTGTDITGRFKRRPSQWTLDEYRSEYDRLNVELSKMREQLIVAQDRENRQVAVLRTELQQLAERIMSTASAEQRPKIERPDIERSPATRQEPVPGRAPAPRTAMPQPANPRPWTAPPPRGQTPNRMIGAASWNSVPGAGQPAAEPRPPVTSPENVRPAPPAASQGFERPIAAPAKADEPDQAARTALKSLLDRGARLPGRELMEKADKAALGGGSGARTSVAPEMEARPAEPTVTSPVSAMSEPAKVEEQPAARPEPQLDRVFREIIEGRASPKPTAPALGEQPLSGETAAEERNDEASAAAAPEGSKTQTLLDRLRHMHERQTG
jgi:hypothetical protein